jgi:hypothetical protein
MFTKTKENAKVLAAMRGKRREAAAQSGDKKSRIHQSLRVTPAMQAGITDRLWSLEDIAAL